VSNCNLISDGEPMSRYDALTAALAQRDDPEIVLTFDELDQIVGGLPMSARTYSAWWANKRTSQPHARAWLDAGRSASPDFQAQRAVFRRLSADAEEVLAPLDDVSGQEALTEYVESTISLERDLEEHLVHNLDALEQGLEMVGRQVTVDVGRIDILARSAAGEKVIIELKVGEAREAAVGQIARYMGWYAKADGTRSRAILVAGSFSDNVRYAASAIPGLRLFGYRVLFTFSDLTLG
jgi:hypothetical protein